MRLTVALALALTASSAAAQDVVRMATEGAYPPYNFINDAGELAGFEIELGNELCARAGLTCEWVQNEWDSVIPNLLGGNFDAFMMGMSITPERLETIAFTEPYMPAEVSRYVALAGADDSAIQGVVSAQTATIQAVHVSESGATLLEFTTAEEALAAVRNGEADAMLFDRSFLTSAIEASDGQLAFVGAEVQLGLGIGMGLRQSDPELKEAFDAAIASMKADGSLNALIEEWHGDTTAGF